MKTKTFLVQSYISFVLLLSLLVFAACVPQDSSIAHADDMAILDVIILDVRTQQEFNTGHIPGAVLLPYNLLRYQIKDLVPDKGQTIVVYCQAGRRSRIAADALIEMGYTSVYDIGGIVNWEGEVVTPYPTP